jgi:hypothetical protein
VTCFGYSKTPSVTRDMYENFRIFWPPWRVTYELNEMVQYIVRGDSLLSPEVNRDEQRLEIYSWLDTGGGGGYHFYCGKEPGNPSGWEKYKIGRPQTSTFHITECQRLTVHLPHEMGSISEIVKLYWKPLK